MYQQQLSDDESYYDEESDTSEKKNQFINPNENEDEGSYYDEEDDEKVGKGYDSSSDIDLTEFTEKDVEQQKLKLLQRKLEEEYQAGFKGSKNVNKMLDMKTLRLTFLNIGPTISNMEFFENLVNLFLQHNCLDYISPNAL